MPAGGSKALDADARLGRLGGGQDGFLGAALSASGARRALNANQRRPSPTSSRRSASGIAARSPASVSKRSPGASRGGEIAPALERAAGPRGDGDDRRIEHEPASADAILADGRFDRRDRLPATERALDHPEDRAVSCDLAASLRHHPRGVDRRRIGAAPPGLVAKARLPRLQFLDRGRSDAELEQMQGHDLAGLLPGRCAVRGCYAGSLRRSRDPSSRPPGSTGVSRTRPSFSSTLRASISSKLRSRCLDWEARTRRRARDRGPARRSRSGSGSRGPARDQGPCSRIEVRFGIEALITLDDRRGREFRPRASARSLVHARAITRVAIAGIGRHEIGTGPPRTFRSRSRRMST